MAIPYSSTHTGAEVDEAVDKSLWSFPLWSLTALTGGGVQKLDGVDVSGILTGTSVMVAIAGLISFYQLQETTAQESSPYLVIPDTEDETTQRGWVLLGVFDESDITADVAAVAASAAAAYALASTGVTNAATAQATANAALPKAGGNMTGQIAEAKGADIASATTCDIGAATGNFVHVTGTVTITGFGTVQAGTRRIVEFTGALILTHNATSLILPGAANITTAAGDMGVFVSEGSGNWRCAGFMRAAALPLLVTGGTVSGALTLSSLLTLSAAVNEAKGADIASASTCDIGAATGTYVVVTGTVTITALGTIQAGTRRVVEFSGALILTHNATSLILPGAANITTVAGDVATFISEGSGNWRCTGYLRSNSMPLLVGASSSTALQTVNSGVIMNILKHGVTALVDGASVTAPDFRTSANSFQTLTLTQNIALSMSGDSYVVRSRLIFVLIAGGASDYTVTLPTTGNCVLGPGTSAVVTVPAGTFMFLIAFGQGISDSTVYWAVFPSSKTLIKNVVLNGYLNEFQGATIASATTTDIGAATGTYIIVSGTVTITGLGTVQAGTRRIVEFSGALVLTHNATSLILPGGANITTTAGDVGVFVSEGSGNWRCVGFTFGASLPLLRSGGTLTGALIGTSGAFSARVTGQTHLTLQSSQTFSATPVWDFDGDGEKTMAVTAAITSMTTSNRAAGKKLTIFLTDDGSARAVAPNGSWLALTAALPAALTASKVIVLTLHCTGTTEGSIIYAWGQTV